MAPVYLWDQLIKSDRQQEGPAEGQQQGHLGGVLGPGLPNKGESGPNAEKGGQVDQKRRKIHIWACRGKNKLFLRKDLTEGCRSEEHTFELQSRENLVCR